MIPNSIMLFHFLFGCETLSKRELYSTATWYFKKAFFENSDPVAAYKLNISGKSHNVVVIDVLNSELKYKLTDDLKNNLTAKREKLFSVFESLVG